MKYRLILFCLFLFILLINVNCEKEDFDSYIGIELFGYITDRETGEPISGVVVSDGYYSTVTTDSGSYHLISHSEARHVFYSNPSDFKLETFQGLPIFYSEICIKNDYFRQDFQLERLKEGAEFEFTLVAIADPQVWNRRTIKRFRDETIKDVIDEIKDKDVVYGINLGDLVNDELDLFGEMKEIYATTEIPFYHTIGNHDFNMDISGIEAARIYEEHFGPINYSFNRGKVHVVVMNNVIYHGNKSYSRGFSKEQIRWLRSNLNYVPKDHMLIICVHIPIRDDDRIMFRDEFLSAIKGFNEIHILSGHTHTNSKFIHKDPKAIEHVTGTASGIWWNGTINRDGTPNGYKVFNIIDNTIVDWYYKSTNFDKEYQMKIYPPHTFDEENGYVIANVWNTDDKWSVELFENGTYRGQMRRFRDYDPGAYELLKSMGLNEPGHENPASWYTMTTNLYKLRLFNTSSSIEIVATDRFGNKYFQNSVVTDIEGFKKY